MNSWKNNKGYVFGLILLFFILLGGLAANRFSNWLGETLRRVDHTQKVRLTLEKASQLTFDAEARERGFLLTGKEVFIATLEPTIAEARSALQQVQALTKDNPAQQDQIARLLPLFDQKVDIMREQTRLRREVGFDAAMQAVSGQQGKRLMDEIQTVIRQMEEVEDALLAERSETAQEALSSATIVITAGGAMMIAFLALAWYAIHRERMMRSREAKLMKTGLEYAESVVDSVRDPIVVLDKNLCVRSCNRAFALTYQSDVNHLRGQPFFELENRAWASTTLETLLRDALESDKPFDDFEMEAKFTSNGSRVMLLNGRKLYRPGNGTGSVVVTIQDITEQRKIESVHLQFQSLFESLPGLYLVLRPDLTIAAVSDAYLSATMTKREEIMNRGIFEVFPDNPNDMEANAVSNLRASLNCVLQNGTTDTMAIQKYDIRRPDGVFEERWWSPVNSPVMGADGKLEYIIHRVEDVTEFVKRREAEKTQKEQAGVMTARMEKMEAEVFQSARQLQVANQELRVLNNELEAFSYSVSHDLRAPLRHIDGFVDLLSKHLDGSVDEKGRRYLTTIAQSARRMGALIDDLLVFSRMGRSAMQKRKLNVNELVEVCVREVTANIQDRKIRWNIHPMPEVKADHSLMRQVFLNLCDNAVKYTRPREEAVIEVGTVHNDGEVIFFVRDNGVGFDMAYADKLFGVFQRLHRADEFEGTGIGLANVRRIILRHSGRIWADSHPGKGTVFYFSLPASEENAEAVVEN